MGCPACSPGAREASECDEFSCIARNVTIIITTSPVQSNPSLELIDWTMHSFRHAPGLAGCKKVLVCDHYKVSEGSSKSFRSGVSDSGPRLQLHADPFNHVPNAHRRHQPCTRAQVPRIQAPSRRPHHGSGSRIPVLKHDDARALIAPRLRLCSAGGS